METSITRSSTMPSIANSYKRITGGTPNISVNPISGPTFKSKKDSALESYEAAKAVEEQGLKDQYIKQYGQASYDYMMEMNKLGMEKKNADVERIKKYGMPNEYQRGIAQAEEQKAASERASNYNYGLRIGKQGFNFPS